MYKSAFLNLAGTTAYTQLLAAPPSGKIYRMDSFRAVNLTSTPAAVYLKIERSAAVVWEMFTTLNQYEQWTFASPIALAPTDIVYSKQSVSGAGMRVGVTYDDAVTGWLTTYFTPATTLTTVLTVPASKTYGVRAVHIVNTAAAVKTPDVQWTDGSNNVMDESWGSIAQYARFMHEVPVVLPTGYLLRVNGGSGFTGYGYVTTLEV